MIFSDDDAESGLKAEAEIHQKTDRSEASSKRHHLGSQSVSQSVRHAGLSAMACCLLVFCSALLRLLISFLAIGPCCASVRLSISFHQQEILALYVYVSTQRAPVQTSCVVGRNSRFVRSLLADSLILFTS